MSEQKIFISYRRSDASGYAGRLFDRLSTHFGDENIFMDVEDMDPGVDFVEILEQAVTASYVLIVLIGSQWLGVEDEDGQRRLDNPEDFVRIEVAAALDRSVRVIPVLVQDARMPGSRELPSVLQKLSRLNAINIRHERFNADVDRLIRSIESYLVEIAEMREREILEKEARAQVERDRMAKELAQREEQINAYLGKARAALKEKDWEPAQRNYRELLRMQPNHTEAQLGLQNASQNLELAQLYGQAILFQDEGLLDRALQNLRQIQEKNADYRDVLERIRLIEEFKHEQIRQNHTAKGDDFQNNNKIYITRLWNLPRNVVYFVIGILLVFILALFLGVGGKLLFFSREAEPKFILDDFGVPMVYIPAGSFQMGSDDGNASEKPMHRVILDAYYIDQYEVTNTRYAQCVDGGVCSAPMVAESFSRESYYGNATYANYPVIWVDWFAAQTYCEWRDARLPTEAEWEKAARGEDGFIYPWGNEFDGSLANFCDTNCEFEMRIIAFNDGYLETAPIGSFPGGVSPYNIFDMAGNVWEWVADWFDDTYYANAPENNPTGSEVGSKRVIRGGSWDNQPEGLRTFLRNEIEPILGSNNIGFRCVRDISSP
jgi:formylglycine-generating enzyme required for sulfatase activity